jgi:hypothetical protein
VDSVIADIFPVLAGYGNTGGILFARRRAVRRMRGMIKHVVMWKMKPFAEGADAAANARIMKERLSALKGIIPQIVQYDCGSDFIKTPASYDFAINCVVKNVDDLKIYNDHPAHVVVKQFIAKVTDARAVVDYEF